MNSLIFLSFAYIQMVFSKKSISDVTTLCRYEDPNLDTCVLKSANTLLQNIKQGFPEYGLPPIDPMTLPLMEIGQDSGPVTLKMELINSVHTGISSIKINSVHIDKKTNVWEFNGTQPYYNAQAQYKGKGRVLLLPLEGEGFVNITLNDVKTFYTVTGKKIFVKHREYFNVEKVHVDFQFASKKNYIMITNLFGRNKELGDATAAWLQQNADEVLNSLKSTLEYVYSELFTHLIKRVTDKIPFKDLFIST